MWPLFVYGLFPCLRFAYEGFGLRGAASAHQKTECEKNRIMCRIPLLCFPRIVFIFCLSACFFFCFFFTVILQRLHATHNLMELLRAKHAGIPPTLRDDQLTEEVIQKHFLSCIFTLKLYFVSTVYLFAFWFNSVLAGGAAATALHDKVRLRGRRCLPESAASVAEYQRVKAQSEQKKTKQFFYIYR